MTLIVCTLFISFAAAVFAVLLRACSHAHFSYFYIRVVVLLYVYDVQVYTYIVDVYLAAKTD